MSDYRLMCDVEAYVIDDQIAIECDDKETTRMYFNKSEVHNLINRLQQLVGGQ